jgi:O-antigen/teichoic acid export membrane protein
MPDTDSSQSSSVKPLSSPSSAMTSARRDSLKILMVRVFASGLAYVTQIALARALGKSEYGTFATVWVWMTILGHSSLLGVGISSSRFIPTYLMQKRFELINGFVTAGSLFVVGVATLCAIGGTAFVYLFRHYLDEPLVAPLLIAMSVLPIFALQDFAEGLARAFKWPFLAIVPSYVLRQGLIVLGTVSALALGAPAFAWVAIVVTLIATLITLIIQIIFIKRALRPLLPNKTHQYAYKSWLLASLPMGMAELTNVLLSFIDVLLLSFLAPSEDVALYFAATRLIQIVAFIQFAASAAMSPRLAEAQVKGDTNALAYLVTSAARLTFFATLVTAIGLIIASPWFLLLFGKGFESGVMIIVVLVMGQILQSLTGPAEDVMNMLGAENVCAKASFSILVIAFVLNICLIPLYGVYGAAFAFSLTALTKGVFFAFLARRYVGIWTPVMFLRGYYART